jgi:hypothetical protein
MLASSAEGALNGDGLVVQLNSRASQYMPGVTAKELLKVAVIKPVLVMRLEMSAEPISVPAKLYRPIQLAPAVGVTAAAERLMYPLVRVVDREMAKAFSSSTPPVVAEADEPATRGSDVQAA